jgi:copper/silver efflux system protein
MHEKTSTVPLVGVRSFAELIETVHAGAVERIRPMAMVPVMWATGTGADLMKRLAAPTVGGVLSAMLLTLIVIPALYATWKWRWEVKPRLTV